MSTLLHVIGYIFLFPVAVVIIAVYVALHVAGVIKVEDCDETDFRRVDYGT